MKMNKLTNLPMTQQSSFESCDSGIDTNSSSSTASSIKYSVSNSSNSSKLSTSSSCSFATASATATNSDSSSTTSPKSSESNSPNEAVYDPFYSSSSSENSNPSKASSSAYLISPLDESGYLVPIVNFSNGTSTSFAPSSTPSQLTRSFSTRSAYNSSAPSNPSKKFNFKNRATICEQIGSSRDSSLAELRTCQMCNKRIDTVLNDKKVWFLFNLIVHFIQ